MILNLFGSVNLCFGGNFLLLKCIDFHVLFLVVDLIRYICSLLFVL